MTGTITPHLVVNSRMLHFCWLPADPEAVSALVPDGLKPLPNRQVFMNQYVVDDLLQTSSVGAYSVTYLGIDLDGADSGDISVTTTDDGEEIPRRWWNHYLSSSPAIRDYALSRGIAARTGSTRIEINGTELVATTESDGVELIRTVAHVGRPAERVSRGQIHYLSDLDGERIVGHYPFVLEPVEEFEIRSLEFLAPGHPVYDLRPANPLGLMWGSYSPRSSFACPGGGWASR